MSESLQWRYCDAHGTGTEYAWGCPECVREMRKEITRLESCLRYEQHRAERIGTHDPGCELWGPAHYGCAVRALKELGSRAERYRAALREVEPYLDAIICYASTQGEHHPNKIAADIRAALAKESKR